MGSALLKWFHFYRRRYFSQYRKILSLVGLLVVVGVFVILFKTPALFRLYMADLQIFLSSRFAPLNYVNRVVFIVWTGTTPLRPVGLATIDSIARHLPNWSIQVHFTKEDKIPDEVYSMRRRNINRQIDFFKSKGVKITSIMHENIKKELSGTIFDGLGIEQKHLGGIYGVEPEWTFGAHASDLLRIFLTLASGGMYMDEDNIVLKDFEPLFKEYGPTILISGEKNFTISYCKETWPQNCWYAHAPYHPFFIDNARRVKAIIKLRGPDCVFLYKKNPELFETCGLTNGGWTIIGPRTFEKTHFFMCDVNPPEIVNELPPHVLSPPIHSVVDDFKQEQRNRSIYAFVNRKYLMPGHWDEPNYLIDDEDNVSERLMALSIAYQFHIYGPIKEDFLKYLHAATPTNHSVMYSLHQSSCQHLCNPQDYDLLINFACS